MARMGESAGHIVFTALESAGHIVATALESAGHIVSTALESVGHFVSTVREQSDKCQCPLTFSSFIQSKTLAYRMVPPTYCRCHSLEVPS